MSSMYPSILQTGGVIGKNLYDWAWEDKKDFWGKGALPDKGTAFDQILRKTFSIYNATTKAIEARTNKYSTESNRFRKLYNDFEDEFDPDRATLRFEATTRSPYYNALRNAFEKGSPKEFSEASVLYYYATASDIYKKGYDMDGIRVNSMNDALKSANKSLKDKIKGFNPTHEPAPRAKRATKIKYAKWLRWLAKNEGKDYINRIKELDTEYKTRRAEMKSQKNHYLRKNNLRDLHKEFDWL